MDFSDHFSVGQLYLICFIKTIILIKFITSDEVKYTVLAKKKKGNTLQTSSILSMVKIEILNYLGLINKKFWIFNAAVANGIKKFCNYFYGKCYIIRELWRQMTVS